MHHTPLSDAISNGETQIKHVLIAAGACTIEPQLGSTLCGAGASGDVNKLKQIAAAGQDLGVADYDGRTAMHLAAANGHVDAIKYLVAAGCNVNATDRYVVDHAPKWLEFLPL